MARIAGVDLPNKSVKIALTYIYGIGRTSALEICEKGNINPDEKMNNLSSEDVNDLRKLIENEYKVEGRLRTEVALNIKRLMDIGVTEVSVIEGVFPYAVREPRRTHVPVRVRKRPLPVRRNKEN